MIQNYTEYRILRVFFDYPTRHFQLREICRTLGMGMPSVSMHVKALERQGFLAKEKRGVYDSYRASMSDIFRLYKRNDVLLRIYESGLEEFIADKIQPDAAVLFGSASKGEDAEGSDIDLLLVAKEREVDLSRFEKRLMRNISLHFEDDVSKLPKELLNNIINGIVIHGYLRVF
jgi:predicted nucleotidyltransferase